ncbi:hypothetical protein SAMN04488134_103270 [Amphibacillus marinus]|uniref:Uncharacterized protein n=1 Tax=Amphibacillus marinus TaxID=872970 RepID=A0A1H8LNH2_9BACI|nr:hypothetical protein [Amphibacillus marinus]SEO06665.1 hypothetical protein SAMN04488134_103270 [Amphibacillus marinus]
MMKGDKLNRYYEATGPSGEQKDSMLGEIYQSSKRVTNPKRHWKKHLPLIPVTAASILLLLILTLFMPRVIERNPSGAQGDHYQIRLNPQYDSIRNSDETFIVEEINGWFEMFFQIEGDNIREINIKAENEYVDGYGIREATEHYGERDYESNYYDSQIWSYNRYYDDFLTQEITFQFDQDFTAHDEINYKWTAWELYKWSITDEFEHYYFDRFSHLSNKALQIVTDNNGGRVPGELQLNDYPDELKEDLITITITDHDGNETVKYIQIKLSNNEDHYMIIQAEVID